MNDVVFPIPKLLYTVAREVLKMFDTDSTGALNVLQFRDAVRNGCQVSADQISDADLLKLFAAVDQDNGGTGSVSIDELSTSSALVELLTPTQDPEQRSHVVAL